MGRPIRSVAFTQRNGQFLVSCRLTTKVIRVWDTRNGQDSFA